jgi:hypothetical protein
VKKTVYFILLTIAVIAAYDIYIIMVAGKPASISATIIRWSHEYPAFVFCMGFTMGHLFWRMPDKSIEGGSK